MSVENHKTLAIIGQGYVGLALAMAAVEAGWTVIGVDNFEAKVSQINFGSSPVEDISDEQLKSAIAKGRYKATTEFSSVAAATVITICVPTPLEIIESQTSVYCGAQQEVLPHIFQMRH